MDLNLQVDREDAKTKQPFFEGECTGELSSSIRLLIIK